MFWAQEESRNSGAWSFVNPRVKSILGHEVGSIVRILKTEMGLLCIFLMSCKLQLTALTLMIPT